MSRLKWSHVICAALCLSVQNPAVQCLSNFNSFLKPPESVVPYSREQDFERYNVENVYVCFAKSDNGAYEFLLACDRSFGCRLLLRTIGPPDEEAVKVLPDLDALSNNCTEVYNNFENGEEANGTRFPLENGKYLVAQAEILQLQFVDVNVTHVPPGYFCKLTSAAQLQLTHNTIRDTRQFGFAGRCGNPMPCCACLLTWLNLQSNRLQAVGRASFCGFPNLETLDLSSNEISKIDENAFVALTKLQTLYVTQNRLKNLPANVFRPLTGLVTLDLYSNLLTEDVVQALRHVSLNVQTHVGNGTIRDGQSSLIELCLRRNSLTSLPAQFQPFQKLQLFDVSHNKISRIYEAVFEPMAELVDVDLSHNRLHSLPDNMLSENGHVQSLRLAENRLQSIPKLNSSSLETLTISSNLIAEVTLNDRENLCQLVNLKYLNLDGNRIKTLVPHVFDCNSTSLTSLVLRNNAIKSISHIFDESHIQVLDLSLNKMNSFSFDDFADHLLQLDLSENELKEFRGESEVLNRPMSMKQLLLSNNFFSNLTNVTLPPKLEYCDLSHNAIRYFSFAKMTDSQAVAIPPTLELVNLRDNWFEVACPLVFYLLDKANKVRLWMGQNPLLCPCEENLFRKYDDDFVPMAMSVNSQTCPDRSPNSTWATAHQPRLKQPFSCNSTPKLICQCNLYDSYSARCNLPCLESCTCHIDRNFTRYSMNCSGRNFQAVPQMSIPAMLSLSLDFSANDLKLLNSSTFASYPLTTKLYVKNTRLTMVTHDAFRNLTDLEVLNLEENLLEELPSGLFVGLTRLTEVYLAKNRLAYLPEDIFQPLVSLQTLQLQSNFLTNFSVWRFQEFATLSSLSLSDNPWSCDCDYVEHFRDGLQNFSYLVNDAGELECTMEDEPAVRYPLLTFNSSYCYTSLPVFIWGSVTHIWTSVVAVVLFLTVLTVTAYIYRREMQVLIYSRYRLRFFHKNQEADEGKVYDAFIAYSGYDVEFFVYNLVPGLEQIERPYKLCIHERDFLVGAVITDSILEAIELSRRTIVVLSQNFVSSGWCRFEFKSAHLQMLSNRCSRIIVILLGDLPQDIDPEIKLYLKTNTYLKWGDKLFWQKLYYALPDRSIVTTNL